jgi:DNA helicase-2/ATP-dependent DNA helicase PcrA
MMNAHSDPPPTTQLAMFGTSPLPSTGRKRPSAHIPQHLRDNIADPLQLNPEQLAVVQAPQGPILVIAGAGSGKTKVLVYRTAWLIASGIHPSRILLLTFTRKAAAQMMNRVQEINPLPRYNIHGGTFHSMAATWLKTYGSALNLSSRFTILDESESASLLHVLASKQHLTQFKGFPNKRTLLSIYGFAANSMHTIADTIVRNYPQYEAYTPQIEQLHRLFCDTKWAQQRFDYDDLLLLIHRLLMEQPEAAARLTTRYQAILVDEYQDTTRLQAELVKLMGMSHRNVLVVGDDSQSIFSFRSADVQNMQAFPLLFDATSTFTLFRNYRSTIPIVHVANKVLEGAPHLHPKTLLAQRQSTIRPKLVQCLDEATESAYVVEQIQGLQKQGLGLHRIAVLFRSSAHSYDLETALARSGMPFVKYGGLALTETAHVKDFLAYLTVARYPNTSSAWHRLLVLIDRIGPATAEQIITSMKTAARPFDMLRQHQGAAAQDLNRLATILTQLHDEAIPLGLRLDAILDHYAGPLKRHYPDDMRERLSELTYLRQGFKDLKDLDAVLEALKTPASSSRQESSGHPNDTLVLSTIHSAKGLEWDAVFLIHVADGQLPHARSFSDPATLEEERRLLYVAVTRPRHRLWLTYPLNAVASGGHRTSGRVSRYLEMLDDTILERVMIA